MLGSVDKTFVLRSMLRKYDIASKERYEESLLDFVEYMWSVVEPSRPFVRGWVLEAVADHLTAVTEGSIKRLLINVPPGFTKSLLTDVFWPAWEWGPRRQPSNRYVCYSYSSHLTERDNMRCRNIISSHRYQKLWGDVCTLSQEQFTKVKFGNMATGWKLATSVQGIGVGERGDRLIIDDPNDTMDMESETMRNTTKLWFTEVIPDRLNSQTDSAIVVIQQRLHEEDVSGIALAREMGYVHLCVQMYYEPRLYCTAWVGNKVKAMIGAEAEKVAEKDIFWVDPRTVDGELAWPERFPLQVCEDLKRDKGPTAWAGQYQQSPKTRGGNIIKEEYWQTWEEERYPALEYILASLDTAYTEKENNDPSALTIWGLFRDKNNNPKVILLYAWRKWLEFHKLISTVIDTCSKDKRIIKEEDGTLLQRFPVDRLIIENKSSGISVAQEMTRLVSFDGKFGIELIEPRKLGDKVARVHAIEHLFSQGLIYAPRREFSDMVIDEMAMFPNGRFDDLSDSTSMALRYMRELGLIKQSDEEARSVADELAYQPKSKPLYQTF